ncbi:MAG: alcohol dehydrogenase catalytic domain-containing protein [Brevundimonas sp.]|uniref:alcohol dehydrogenase catalytic domain-containing protein n=1 Tax=Brevundimonas sp. TaxID=1871086 RepID=UPI002487084B|nr:alcohol dehydrogenase catalytic domain-containing protein [Brevundimonas sp.]MDI1327727.1 alcohol dehydrogenase catalytic domain-containing protein [Brevundimonas sp.]
MLTMVLREAGGPLVPERRPDPVPGPGQVRLKVSACGVCRTDLHIVDGDLAPRRPTIIPGHEVVGIVDAIGPGVERGARRSAKRAVRRRGCSGQRRAAPTTITGGPFRRDDFRPGPT